jgi:hypothetical protein
MASSGQPVAEDSGAAWQRPVAPTPGLGPISDGPHPGRLATRGGQRLCACVGTTGIGLASQLQQRAARPRRWRGGMARPRSVVARQLAALLSSTMADTKAEKQRMREIPVGGAHQREQERDWSEEREVQVGCATGGARSEQQGMGHAAAARRSRRAAFERTGARVLSLSN